MYQTILNIDDIDQFDSVYREVRAMMGVHKIELLPDHNMILVECNEAVLQRLYACHAIAISAERKV